MSEARRTEIMEHVMDTQTSTWVNMSIEHHQVHEGYLFSACMVYSTVVPAGGNIALVLEPPGSTTAISRPFIHLQAWGGNNTNGALQLDLIELPAVGSTVLATTITPVNQRRWPAAAPASSIVVLPRPVTTNTTSVILKQVLIGSNNNQGRTGQLSSDRFEWVLNPVKRYAIRAINKSAGNGYMSLDVAWYQRSFAVS